MTRAPQLCLGQVRHTRLRPVQHAFGYGVYFIRLPLRSLAAAGKTDFGSRLLSRNRFNLLSFHDRDHGDQQGQHQGDLLGWIEAQLRQHGVHDADGEIWLQCFPRVLGYVFNPVSFWFCHRADGSLRAILCEVRNTFGERHCYLLDQGHELEWGQELQASKIFHVSPFCEVQGHYRFRFMQREASACERQRHLACIDYHDGADGVLLQTSVSGEAHALQDGRLLRTFFTYPLQSFGVMARIHWQALRLWLKRVPFFSKPEPPASKVS
ncbi:DUF1365 domain-containing protein [Herbaspirillum lusitanum]|uniref:DUF1365 domain-containing protein n=1 Tax=Herbaspirillum lusitanum TaxID=213312 RepID=A0ABW9AA89_9BURK